MTQAEKKYIINTVLNFYPKLDHNEAVKLLEQLEKQKIIQFRDVVEG